MSDNSVSNSQINENSTGSTPLYQQYALQSMEPDTRESMEKIYQIDFKFEEIGDLVKALNSQDVIQQYQGCIGLRKLLSMVNPPIQTVIDANCVPSFIEFMKQTNHPVLQLEAAWCLTNIASRTTQQTQSIIDNDVITLFCKLLTSSFSDVSEKAIWAIGNISGTSSVYRDMILKCDGLKPLVNILLNTQDKKIIKHGSWALSNLCRVRPLPQFELVKEAIPPLSKILSFETDSEVLTDVSWAICSLSDGDEDRVQLVVDSGIIPSLIKHINQQDLSVLFPCLRTIGAICSGSESQTDTVIAYGSLPAIFKLVQHQEKSVRREACWVLSNIAAGNAQQIALIINENSCIESLFKCIISDSEDVSREAVWVISNCTFQANPQEILRLVDLKVLEIFSQILKISQDSQTLTAILESLKHILECGDKDYKQGPINPFVVQLENLGALNAIVNLNRHPENDISQRAHFIIEKYFLNWTMFK